MLKVKNKSIKCNYLASSDSIHAVFSLLDSPGFPLSNEYKFMRLAYVQVELFPLLS